ncbi:hypothetical protein MITS9509_01344 [Synechococcus sp. MIT S9509]|uniref:hypothetical protein n=1 Tax=Synechococcus sp. MIT S9509 TaxID=1801630 RepID=UPI0007BB9995|nr:hypothetical protein [Synechococcus sp. MIT S9509]KZR92357.1 hypothetical protein MITS9509_01344 [Synechococcus sp. MIT S9509]
MANTPPKTYRVKPESAAAIERVAEEHDRSMSWVVNRIFDAWRIDYAEGLPPKPRAIGESTVEDPLAEESIPALRKLADWSENLIDRLEDGDMLTAEKHHEITRAAMALRKALAITG